MNQKHMILNLQSEGEARVPVSRTVTILRQVLLALLNRASEGHFILRERGKLIAEIGDRNDPLKAEVDILDQRVYARALLGGNTAAGEAFVDGWWTSPDITQVTRFFCRNLDMMDGWDGKFAWLLKPISWLRLLRRANTNKQAKRNILAHYDLGNDLYRSFLDPRMQYSSALYQAAGQSLEQAQLNKLSRLCERLELTADDHLLEVGGGWGGLAIYAASRYGCRVTSTTISDQQYDFATAQVASAGLSDRVEILNRDYRSLQGQYDKIVSVEMIEAVGRRFLPGYFRKLDSLLKPGGLLMLQAITMADQRFDSYSRSEDFIQKHIFPGGFLPSMSLMSGILADQTQLIIRDVLDMGSHYAQTLAQWRDTFLSAQQQIEALGYDERFRNLWLYYLGYCEGGFRERRISAVQLLSSKAPHRPVGIAS